MPEPDFAALDERQALRTLDVHYGMELGCTVADLHRPYWTVVAARTEADPMALLFGRRMLVHLLVPSGEQGGVVAVAPELRPHIAAFLDQHTPGSLFGMPALGTLDALVRRTSARLLTDADEAHTTLHCTWPAAFRPYVGQWLEWVEPLDEAREMDPAALGLLARYGGGVYVARQDGDILAFAGLRVQSPHVWSVDVAVRVGGEQRIALAQAVLSRATRAALVERRLPLLAHAGGDGTLAEIAASLGFRPYGDAIVYMAAS